MMLLLLGSGHGAIGRTHEGLARRSSSMLRHASAAHGHSPRYFGSTSINGAEATQGSIRCDRAVLD